MNFSKALKKLKKGKMMTRASWSSKGATVHKAAYRKGIKPFFLICFDANDDEMFSPWVPSVGDLFAEDWQKV